MVAKMPDSNLSFMHPSARVQVHTEWYKCARSPSVLMTSSAAKVIDAILGPRGIQSRQRERERESLLPLQFRKEQQAENAFSKDDNDLQVGHELELTAARCSAKNPC